MSEPLIHEGGCHCGRIRYRLHGPIPPGAHCHCSICRRTSGAVTVTWFTVPLDTFEFTRGEPAVHRSSEHAERRFCPGCGAQLAFYSRKQPDCIDITVATLDDADKHPADHHVYYGDRLPWLVLDEHLIKYLGDTPPEHPTADLRLP